MTEFRRQGQSGGGSAASVPSDQIFDSASLRDAFFAANPQRLIDGAQCVVLTSAPEGLYQVYTLGVWQDRSKVVIGRTGPQGLTGEKGDHVDGAEFVGDDIVFSDTGGRTFPLADAVNVLKGPQGEAAFEAAGIDWHLWDVVSESTDFDEEDDVDKSRNDYYSVNYAAAQLIDQAAIRHKLGIGKSKRFN
ncbi:hypothetical protein FXE84_17450 [Vibrio cholerae]|uniref:hypothetical protein n=1 Tax=Vibrio cholerae TaxID=666 RepID=UPI0004E3E40E|nr:hypothetical protein [Vibrio cholerae]KFE28217.1 hypothetical protein DN30_1243 [Vibrio cholerae]TXY40855.1 hypothetical protein FXE84_17450 [Vibrio cholerae]GHW90173.1 hypothetical protein VCSRO105_0673 [Vibrio cholerae]